MVAEGREMNTGPLHRVLMPYLPKSPSQPGAPVPTQTSDSPEGKFGIQQWKEVAHPKFGAQPLVIHLYMGSDPKAGFSLGAK